MGVRGPAPKPTAIRELEGNPSKRPLPENEPTPPAGMPECPRYFKGRYRKAWDAFAPILFDMGVLTLADGWGLEQLCLSYGRLHELREALRKHGNIYVTTTGYPVQRPEVSMYERERSMFMKWCDRFGLNPSARTRIMAILDGEGGGGPGGGDDPMEEVLG